MLLSLLLNQLVGNGHLKKGITESPRLKPWLLATSFVIPSSVVFAIASDVAVNVVHDYLLSILFFMVRLLQVIIEFF